jgi:hypothetical protein
MLRIFAGLVGIMFIIIAVLGFMPEYVHEGKLLGTFAINSLSNILHLATGIIGLMCGVRGTRYSKYFFIALGLFYGILALMGFYDSTMLFFRFIVTNGASNFFHAIIAIVALYLGFGYFSKKATD